jgi:cysteinyl-tRNA synthetase
MTSIRDLRKAWWIGILGGMAMFPRFFRKKKSPPLFFYDSLSKEKKVFSLAPHARNVRMYNCGPTVYDVSHIGNLRSYVFADLVRRALIFNGYTVRQVINITDFGHLSSDGDLGHDKMSMALKREGLDLTLPNMRTLAERYTILFIEDLKKLAVETEHIQFPRASDHIADEIALAKTLEEKGYAYHASEGLYFDTATFPAYGKLGNINLEGQLEGARVSKADDKRNPSDFLLWKTDAHLGWESPWGKGFPGWHIECSAMINATLGKQIDIHTGGIDLIPTHHNNEIAQSESATGRRPFSRFWMHNEFLTTGDTKISKSLRNTTTLAELEAEGFHPLSFRYFLLGAHYRTPQKFSREALAAAETAFLKLRRLVDSEKPGGSPNAGWMAKLQERLNDDLDTPGALALLWEMIKDRALEGPAIRATILETDKVLGLRLAGEDMRAQEKYKKLWGAPLSLEEAPEEIRELLKERDLARLRKDWAEADRIRTKLTEGGYSVEDSLSGPQLFKK